MKLPEIVLAGTLLLGSVGCSEPQKFWNRVDGEFNGYKVVAFTDEAGRHLIMGDFDEIKGYLLRDPEGSSLNASDREHDGKFENYGLSDTKAITDQHPLMKYYNSDSITSIYNLLIQGKLDPQ